MNDFTKEELEELSFWLTRLAMMENKMYKLKSIHEKIQSMIDNYCEHKNTRNGDPCQECEDCGKQII